MATIIGYMQSFFDAIFGTSGIASTLVTWLTATGHEIALIPLVLWVMIALVGCVRRLLPGV